MPLVSRFVPAAVLIVALATPAAVLAAVPASAAGGPAVQVVARGLDNPRKVHIARDGTVHVVEAGRGGDDCRVLPPQGDFSGEVCFGLSGAVTELTHRGTERVVTDLPSFAGRDGFAALGPHDVTTSGSGRFQMAIAGSPYDERGLASELRPEYSPLLGTVTRVNGAGRTTILADLLAHEEVTNGDGAVLSDGRPNIESNPYGLLDGPALFGVASTPPPTRSSATGRGAR